MIVQFLDFLNFLEVTGPGGLKDAERTGAESENPDDSRNPNGTQGMLAAPTLVEDVNYQWIPCFFSSSLVLGEIKAYFSVVTFYPVKE